MSESGSGLSKAPPAGGAFLLLTNLLGFLFAQSRRRWQGTFNESSN
jgi:hypothetical protein